MKNDDWTIQFAKTICEIMSINNELSKKHKDELDLFFKDSLQNLNVKKFVN